MTRREPKGTSQRQLRVGEEIRHALAWVLERGELRDPGLQGVSVTISEVRVSPDLRNATAFAAPLGGGDAAATVAALTRARSFLRRRVAESVHLKYVPALTFRADPSFDEATRIDALLRASADAGDATNEDGDGA